MVSYKCIVDSSSVTISYKERGLMFLPLSKGTKAPKEFTKVPAIIGPKNGVG